MEDGDEDFDEDEMDDDGHEEDENDDEEDADDDDEKGLSSLSNPLEKSSDPKLPFLVFRGASPNCSPLSSPKIRS